jgi:putative ABC transport system ATP-binding protein
MSLIELIEVTKQYQRGKRSVQALQPTNLTIEAGELIALWGPSGSGKSTLCNLIGLIDKPDDGYIRFNGRDLTGCGDTERSAFRIDNIGFIFQSFNLIPVFSALENVLLPLQLRSIITDGMKSRAIELLKTMGLEDEIHRRPDELSGGQQQRVAIARALIKNPALVIADEPTANLDTVNALNIIEIMVDKNRSLGTTFLLSTHDVRILDRVIRSVNLCDGTIIADARQERFIG